MLSFEILEFFPFIYIIISLIGIIISRFHLIIMLLALDMIIFSVSLLFIYQSFLNCDPAGQVYALLLLPIATTETALGLSLLVVIYKYYSQTTFVSSL